MILNSRTGRLQTWTGAPKLQNGNHSARGYLGQRLGSGFEARITRITRIAPALEEAVRRILTVDAKALHIILCGWPNTGRRPSHWLGKPPAERDDPNRGIS